MSGLSKRNHGKQVSSGKRRGGRRNSIGSSLAYHVEELETRRMLAVFTVNTTDDAVVADAFTSLREAIISANTSDDVADSIEFDNTVFNVARTITLTGGELPITDSLAINGTGMNLLTVTSATSRVFNISDLAGDVALSGMTLTGAAGVGNDGGAILSAASGPLSIVSSKITGSTADAGAGIFVTGVLTVTNSTISDNTATSNGGGIHINDESEVTVQGSTLSGNDADFGAGIFVNESKLSVISSTISGNDAVEDGGGIYASYDNDVTIRNSTISGNTALDSGGGVYGYDGNKITIENSTISGNTAATDGGGVYNGVAGVLNLTNSTISGNTATNGDGGGIAGAAVTLKNVTVTDNEATAGEGGGVAVSGLLRSRNSIISGNTNVTNPDLKFGTQEIRFSLIGNATGTTLVESLPPTADANGNFIGKATPINANLGALANNGGPTQTHALLVGSAAIDKGRNNFASGLTSDQRGTPYVRISGVKVDMGAFEVQPEPAAAEINVQGNGTNIASGDVTPSALDDTSFGSVNFNIGTIVKTFTIQNTGGSPLTVTNVQISGVNAGDFTVTADPVSPVNGGASTTFNITFNPSALGTRSATVTINNSDADEAVYTFAIQGVGTDVVGPLPFVEDFNDGSADGMTVEQGVFNVVNQKFVGDTSAAGRNNFAVATVDTSANLAVPLDIRATAITTAKVGETNYSNAFIVFDYKSATDFKVAGYLNFLNRWVIGRVTKSGFQQLAASQEIIPVGTPLDMQVLLTGRTATLRVNGVQKATYTYPTGQNGETTFTGKIGLGTHNSQTTFDDFSIAQAV